MPINRFRPRVEGLEDRLAPATFTVTTINNAGSGSLRAAIAQANSTPGADTIEFDIGTGAKRIELRSALPAITETLTLDGTTQSGFVNNPIIVIDGTNAGSGVDGLTIASTAPNCLIEGLVIRGFSGNGIVIHSGGNTVQTCFIGTNATGTASVPNKQNGILITGTAVGNRIGGSAAGTSNLISGNNKHGVLLQGPGVTGTVIQRNYIGPSADGERSLGNRLDGVAIVSGANGNTVGGNQAGNFIAGNGRFGVHISGTGTTGNTLTGNVIGSNISTGVQIANGAASNTIGGSTVGLGNVISANGLHGVVLTGAGVTGNVLAGNFIGTSGNGTAALGNRRDGVVIADGASNNTIGGTVAGVNNLISGNGRFGVNITGEGTTGNTVAANAIGPNVTGTAALPNGFCGIQVANGADGNTIGGTVATATNAISGNTKFGILITGADNTLIQGNRIGTQTNGTGVLGNQSHGIFVTGGAQNTTIGGTNAAAKNIIANNGGNGVLIGSDPSANFKTAAGVGNAVLGNSIFGNTLLGIDLGPNNGTTANDAGDPDGGPNGRQNFPNIVTATAINGRTQVQVTITLSSTPNTTFRIEFYASPSADATGFGEGQNFLGFIDVTTDGTGAATGNGTFTFSNTLGVNITATATNLTTNDTSEFSSRVAV